MGPHARALREAKKDVDYIENVVGIHFKSFECVTCPHGSEKCRKPPAWDNKEVHCVG